MSHPSTGEEGDKARQRRSDLCASSSMGESDRGELEVAEEAHLQQRKAASPPTKGSMPSSLYEGVVGYDSPTMGKVCLLPDADAQMSACSQHSFACCIQVSTDSGTATLALAFAADLSQGASSSML